MEYLLLEQRTAEISCRGSVCIISETYLHIYCTQANELHGKEPTVGELNGKQFNTAALEQVSSGIFQHCKLCHSTKEMVACIIRALFCIFVACSYNKCIR